MALLIIKLILIICLTQQVNNDKIMESLIFRIAFIIRYPVNKQLEMRYRTSSYFRISLWERRSTQTQVVTLAVNQLNFLNLLLAPFPIYVHNFGKSQTTIANVIEHSL